MNKKNSDSAMSKLINLCVAIFLNEHVRYTALQNK